MADMNPSRSILIPVIDSTRCTGCGWCVPSCPLHLLSLQPQGWRKFSTLHDAERCVGCRKCEPRCPFGAIRMALPEEGGD
jgi:NAD-dependent dihydropyrimidine dehydrogenase PreA subunit